MVDKMLCACRHVLKKRLMQREGKEADAAGGLRQVQGAHRSNTWPMAANCANTSIILHRHVTITMDIRALSSSPDTHTPRDEGRSGPLT